MSALLAAKQQNKQRPAKQAANDAASKDVGGGPAAGKDSGARPADAKNKVGPDAIINKQKAAYLKAQANAGANSDPDFQRGLDGKATAKGKDVGTSSGGEPNPMTQSKRGKGDKDVDLSAREQRAAGLDKRVLPFLEGMTANMIDIDHKWVKAAREMKMPLRAGISGTTQRVDHDRTFGLPVRLQEGVEPWVKTLQPGESPLDRGIGG